MTFKDSLRLLFLLLSTIHSNSKLSTVHSNFVHKSSPPLSCSSDQFACFDRSKCIPMRSLCDEHPDCDDASDETESVCRECAVVCKVEGRNRCIGKKALCDGVFNCDNGIDETPSLCDNCNWKDLTRCAGMAASVLRLRFFAQVSLGFIIARTALTNLTPGQIAPFAQRRAPCHARVFPATVQKSATGSSLVRMLGTSCSPLARPTRPAAARRPDSFSALMAPTVLIASRFATLSRIVKTGRTRVLSCAKTSASHSAL